MSDADRLDLSRRNQDGAGGDGQPTMAPGNGWIERWFGSRLLLAVVLSVCFLAPSTLVLLHIDRNPRLSPIDEVAHLDYVMRAAEWEIPRTGDRLTSRSLRIGACSGSVEALPLCGKEHIRAQEFPNEGFQYEAQQPPPYYFATAALRSFNEHVLGIDDYLEATRITGVVWLGLGLLLLWFAGRVWKVDPWAMAGALLILATAPNVVYYASIVTNDVTSVLAASAVAFVAGIGMHRPGPRTPWFLASVAFAACLLKPMNLLAVGAFALFFLVRTAMQEHQWWSRRHEIKRKFLPNGGALILGGLSAVGLWLVVNNALAYVDPQTLPVFSARHVSGFPLFVLVSQGSALLGLATDSAPTEAFFSTEGVWFIQLTKALFLATGLVGLLVARRAWNHVLGLCVMAVIVFGGIGISLLIWATLRMDPGVVSRYGLPLAPLLVICMAAGARNNMRNAVLWFVALGLFVTTGLALL